MQYVWSAMAGISLGDGGGGRCGESSCAFIADIRRQLADQLGSLEFRMESKVSLLSEFQEFFKRRGEVHLQLGVMLVRI